MHAYGQGLTSVGHYVDKIRHHLRPGCYVGLRELPCQQRRRHLRGGILRQRLHRHRHRQLLALWLVDHGGLVHPYVLLPALGNRKADDSLLNRCTAFLGTAASCPALSDATVSWPAAAAGATVSGVCASGYGGSTQRVCSASGVWLKPTGVACARTWSFHAVGNDFGRF